MTEGAPSPLWRQSPRKNLRAHLVTQVESRASGATSVGQTGDISEGGLLVLSHQVLPANTEVLVRLKLPSGHAVEARGVVMRAKPGVEMGIRFLELKDEDRKAILAFVREVKPYQRRSARLQRRFPLVLRWQDFQGNAREELVETELISKHGGMVLSPVSFKPGEDVYVWWPEKQRGARARIVFRQLGRVENLAELGLEFLDTDNFWEVEFPPDTSLLE